MEASAAPSTDPGKAPESKGVNWGAVLAVVIVILLILAWSGAIPQLTDAAANLGRSANDTLTLVWTGAGDSVGELWKWLQSLGSPSVGDAQKTLQQADVATQVLNAQVDAATIALAATPSMVITQSASWATSSSPLSQRKSSIAT
jgi:hypothetical protein